MKYLRTARLICALSIGSLMGVHATSLEAYNVVWDSPSQDMHGSMPIGNGDLAANVWVEPNGDLVFYLSKSDAWSGKQELLKLGRIRVRLDKAFVREGAAFKQELDLETGTIRISTTGDTRHTTLSFWIDANHPVVNIEIDGAEAFSARVSLESWRTPAARRWGGAERDTILPPEGNAVRWYQRNTRSMYADTLKNQHLGHLLGKYPDPLMHRTFGGQISGEGLVSKDAKTLVSQAPTRRLHLRVHALTAQTATPGEWVAQLQKQRADIEQLPLAETRKQHEAYWADFWGRSWVFASAGDGVGNIQVSSLVPANTLNFKFGINQWGRDKFSGQMGRASLFARALSLHEVRKLSSGQSLETGVDKAGILYSAIPALYSELEGSAGWSDGSAMTVEAWIKPAADAGSARILDKSLPGSEQGLLLDTHPGNSLRLIMGERRLSAANCLKPEQWHHVAVVMDAARDRLEVYLDGQRIAGRGKPEKSIVTTAVTRAYVLQRWIQACAGRGAYPIKFNGSLFTVDGVVLDKDKQRVDHGPDFRKWGGCYWFQNTREPYWAMLYSGDFEQMEPLWRMYREALPLLKERTRAYFNHEGIFCSETMHPWGLNKHHDFGMGNKGLYPTNPYIRYYWDSGNELSMMMLDCYAHTRDEAFAKSTLLPIADEVVKYYDQHHKRNAQGKVHFSPAMSLETWHVAEDPLPVIVGLNTVLTGLLTLPETLTTPEQRERWQRLLKELPGLPFGEGDGKKWLKPAHSYSQRKNSENPELYAVFPYRAYTVGNPGLELGRETWRRRKVKGTGGWRQDAIQAALLGLTDEAKGYVEQNATNRSPIGAPPVVSPRFPAFWGPNFDWTPDQCHGSVTMIALQRMLMQCHGDVIRLLPAWPKDWDADFKLHAPQNTIVEGRVEKGKVIDLKVTPESRRKDVVVTE